MRERERERERENLLEVLQNLDLQFGALCSRNEIVLIGCSHKRSSSVGIATRLRARRSGFRILPIPVVEGSKARVCGRALTGVAGSNSAGNNTKQQNYYNNNYKISK